MKKNKLIFLILLLIVLCIFFRTYKLETFYIFEHDQDLSSWIVKDILVDHHPRLIGQLTSIDGVFIGPLFYYLLVPFFALFKMDPLSGSFLVLIISVFTVISIYFVFSKHFSKNTGLIGAFIYSVSVGSAFNDRWVVPTQPTLIWCVWYLYVILCLIKGNYKVLPLLGLLVGLIWHIHIALIVLLLPIPVAIFLSKKRISLKDLILPLVIFLIFTTPFWLFEIRQNHQQITGLVKSFSEERGELKGIYRLEKEFTVSARAFLDPIIISPKTPPVLGYLSFFSIFFFLVFKNRISRKMALIISFWIGIFLFSQLISKRPLTEYYFSNFNVLTILVYSLLLSYIYDLNKGKFFAKSLIVLYLLFNLVNMLGMPDAWNGYLEKKKLVDFVVNDSENKKFPCIGINYIADYGTGVGFRYLFWYKGIKLVNAGKDVPVYNIVIPHYNAESEVIYGYFGLIKPTLEKFENKEVCNSPEKQLLPMLGFTK